MLDVKQIQKVLPHRYPFLFVDRIIELEPGKRAVGIKNVTINEPFFEGHFPAFPVMPGVLIVEALAQTSAFIIMGDMTDANKIGVLAGIDGMRFKKQVIPGDTLTLNAELVSFRHNFGKANVTATVDSETAATGIIMFAIVDI